MLILTIQIFRIKRLRVRNFSPCQSSIEIYTKGNLPYTPAIFFKWGVKLFEYWIVNNGDNEYGN